MKRHCKPVEKQIFISLIVFIFLLGPNISFGQKHFYANEKKMYEKFKIADAIFFKGKEYFLKGNYKKAEKELKKCIETMPEHVEAHFYLSHVLYKKEDFQKALEHIEKAKANFELMADLFTYAHHQYILQLREQVDTIDSQISDLQDKLFGTTDADTKRNFEAQISSLEQKKGTIRSRLTEPVSPSESIPADYFYFHGNILFRLNKHQEAFREYLEAIKKIPSMGMLTIILLICILWAKQYQKALDSLNRAEANGVKTNPKLKKAILKAIKK